MIKQVTNEGFSGIFRDCLPEICSSGLSYLVSSFQPPKLVSFLFIYTLLKTLWWFCIDLKHGGSIAYLMIGPIVEM